MNFYYPQSLQNQFTPKNMVFSTWIDHMAFGYDLISAMNPKTLVELGSHSGFSFFVFCQSIKENTLDTQAYAVDTWEGDTQTGAYSEDVFQSVKAHLEEEYPKCSNQMRMLFNDAIQHFEDNSVELLHIDGLHTYEAVSEDFRNWYPKVKPGGVILFHDIKARRKDFGVWKFWEEATQEHKTFTFNHSFGLGVLQKHSDHLADEQHPLLELLFNSSTEDRYNLRQLYINLSMLISLKRREEKGHLKPIVGEQKVCRL